MEGFQEAALLRVNICSALGLAWSITASGPSHSCHRIPISGTRSNRLGGTTPLVVTGLPWSAPPADQAENWRPQAGAWKVQARYGHLLLLEEGLASAPTVTSVRGVAGTSGFHLRFLHKLEHYFSKHFLNIYCVPKRTPPN